MASATYQQSVVEPIDLHVEVGMQVFDSNGDSVGIVRSYSAEADYLIVGSDDSGVENLHIPFRLIHTGDAREIYLTLPRDTLVAQFTRPPEAQAAVDTRILTGPPGTTTVQTRKAHPVRSGYDGTPVTVDEVDVSTSTALSGTASPPASVMSAWPSSATTTTAPSGAYGAPAPPPASTPPSAPASSAQPTGTSGPAGSAPFAPTFPSSSAGTSMSTSLPAPAPTSSLQPHASTPPSPVSTPASRTSSTPVMVASGDDATVFLSSQATRTLITVVVLLGYAALAAAGFGTYLGTDVQALSLYVYLGLLLLALPFVIAPSRSTTQILYTFVGTAFFEVYVGVVDFDKSPANFTRNSYTYLVLEGVLLAVFLTDAIGRRLGVDGSGASTSSGGGGDGATSLFGPLSIDFAGLAVFFYIAAFLLDLLGPQHVLRVLGGVPHARPYLIVDLNAALGFHLPQPLDNLQSLDLALAVGATAVALLLFALVGNLRVTGLPTSSASAASASATSTSSGLASSVIQLVDSAADQVLLSVRSAVSPLMWLGPAVSAGALAQGIVSYLNRSAAVPGPIADLFNPLSHVGLLSLERGLGNLALATVAVGAGTLTVVLEDHDWAAARRMAELLGATGRALPLTLPLYLYSLAALNAVIVLFVPTTPLPFRVGTLGLFALVAGASFLAGLAVAATPSSATISIAPSSVEFVGSPQVRSRVAIGATE